MQSRGVMTFSVPVLAVFLVAAQLGLYPGPDATAPGFSVISGDLTGNYVILQTTVIATDVTEAMLNAEFGIQVNGLADAFLIGGSSLAWADFCGDGAVWELDGTSCGGDPLGPSARIPLITLHIEGRPLDPAPTLCLVPPSTTGPSFYSSPPAVSYVRSFASPVQWAAFDLVEGGCASNRETVSIGSPNWGTLKARY
jgi:hypothetical protein